MAGSSSSSSSSSSRAVVLTGTGVGGIAVIRMTGERVGEFLSRHFSRSLPPQRCTHGELRDRQGKLVDDAVVVAGDSWAEVNVHGGAWVINQVLSLAQAEGFEAGWGQIGDVDAVEGAPILEREVVAWLPGARTELAVRALAAQPRLWADLAQRGLSAAAAEEMLNRRALWWLLHPPRVAIVGIANVGKSTLANQLFGRERSIVADVPGTTRDWIGEYAEIIGLAILLVDTPGLRDSPDAIEQQAIAHSAGEVAGADFVIVVLDGTQEDGPQRSLSKRWPDALVVANKADQPWQWDVPGTRISARSGQGIDVLRAQIANRFGIADAHRAGWWTDRQRAALDSIARGAATVADVVAGQ